MAPNLKTAIESAMIFGWIGQPEDAGRLILFLASDAGQRIAGQILPSRGQMILGPT